MEDCYRTIADVDDLDNVENQNNSNVDVYREEDSLLSWYSGDDYDGDARHSSFRSIRHFRPV